MLTLIIFSEPFSNFTFGRRKHWVFNFWKSGHLQSLQAACV